jgi:NDP-sugar pyrophosphorylase family protein
MPLGDLSILEIIIRQLARSGFGRITVAVNHQAELIQAFFHDGAKWKVAIDYSLEDEPLGTMGPLSLIRDLPENFLVMNGDTLTDLDYDAFHRTHVEARNLFTISSHVREHVVDYGVLKPDAKGRLTGFEEKPRLIYEVSMGVYMCSREVVSFIPKSKPYGFDQLMLDLIRAGRPAQVLRHAGYWRDIGRPEDYQQATEDFDQLRTRFLGE